MKKSRPATTACFVSQSHLSNCRRYLHTYRTDVRRGLPTPPAARCRKKERKPYIQRERASRRFPRLSQTPLSMHMLRYIFARTVGYVFVQEYHISKNIVRSLSRKETRSEKEGRRASRGVEVVKASRLALFALPRLAGRRRVASRLARRKAGKRLLGGGPRIERHAGLGLREVDLVFDVRLGRGRAEGYVLLFCWTRRILEGGWGPG